MEIKKISDSQVQLILTSTDMEDKNINIRDFFKGSKEARKIIDDLIYEAAKECDIKLNHGSFIGVDIPEAREDHLVLMLTILNGNEKGEAEIMGSLAGLLKDLKSALESEAETCTDVPVKPARKTTKKTATKKVDTTTPIIYSFDNFDYMTMAANALTKSNMVFEGSKVFKMKNKYYLVLDKKTVTKVNAAESLLYEFGGEKSTMVTEHILEHGEILIKENAINVLNTYF